MRRDARRQRGFTLVELAVTITITAILLPATFLLFRAVEGRIHGWLASARVAESTRTFSEELRRDLRTMRFTAETGFTLASPGCEVRYVVEGTTLMRHGCDGDRAIARDVETLARTAWGAEITYASHVAPPKAPKRTTFRIGLAR